MKKHVFFDVGGVLFQTADAVQTALTFAAGLCARPLPEDFASFCGVSVPDAVIDAYGIGLSEAEPLIRAYQDCFLKDALYQCTPFEGAEACLHTLCDQGLRLYAVSSMLHSALSRLLEYWKLDGFFTEIRGVSSDYTISNKEDVLRFAMQKSGLFTAKSGRLGAVRKDIVIVGDRWQDKVAATCLGVDFVGVSYGYAKGGELSDCMMVNSLSELEKKLLEMR